jgi:Zn-dependent protease with chaperone function
MQTVLAFPARPGSPDERVWTPWSAAERESFFDAIARHRRASWRITAACVFAVTVLTMVVAALLSPLLICVIGLVVDVINLLIPMPDVLSGFGRWIDPLFDEKTFTTALAIKATAVASLPGLGVMAVIVLALNRVLKRSPLFDAGDLPGRAPARTVLAEQRLLNVVEEMALAARIPLPAVRIIPGGINAAVFGRDEAHTTILVGEGLLTALDRGQMQGAIAHLIGSIAGGDMPIGLRAAVTFALFGLLARCSGCMGDRGEFQAVLRMFGTLIWPTRARTETLVRDLADPFAPPVDADAAARKKLKPERKGPGDLTWREWALMPLMGPVILSGFMSGIVSTFLLSPLVSFAWRRRKYMADAAAVRLTRDPDTLAGALQRIFEQGGTGLQGWTLHMAIAQGPGVVPRGLLGGQIVSIFPPTEKRYQALGTMGASLKPLARQRPMMPTGVLLLITALGSIAGVLMAVAVVLLVWLSFAISGLFTVFPAAMIHALLRWIGH